MKAASLLARIKWSQENEALRYFQPHGGQEEFIRLIDGGFIVISGAGNGWGKSEILAAIFAAAMWPGLAPKALAIPTLQNWPHPKRARIYSKPAELEEIGSLQTAIKRLFPAGRYEMSKGRYGYPSVFQTDTGWILDLFSYERHESEAAGPNIGLQGFNEPPPEPLWKEAVARSRAGGIIIGGFTSLLDNVWVVDGILGKDNGKDIRVRYGSSCENCKTHGVNGNLEHDQIEKVLAQYDQDEREARFSGRPLSMSGRIYKKFDRNVHVIEPLNHPSSAVYQVIDPAGGKPFAVIWAQVDSGGNVTVFDEWPNTPFFNAKDPGLDINGYVDIFKQKEAHFKVQTRIIDRRYGNTRHKPGANTIREDFEAEPYNLEFVDSYSVAGTDEPDVETGIMGVNKYLDFNKSKPIDSVNKPKLLITSNCRNTIESLERWARNPKTLHPKDDHYKDFNDCLRYLVMANPQIEAVQSWPNISRPFHGVS